MGYRINTKTMNDILSQLGDKYKIFGPAWDGPKQNVRYRPIKNIEDIVTDRQSDFSIKEAFYPISQVMVYFHADSISESEIEDDRDILIFARPCDMNGVTRLDKIFLENGGHSDFFYERLRKKVKFVLLECAESFEECFCVSLGTNINEDYALAVRLDKKGTDSIQEILVDLKDGEFEEYFGWEEEVEFSPEFVRENKKKMTIPNISRDNLKQISELEYWTKYDDNCIGCGGCNTVCGTCSCFDTSDVIYEEGKPDGERRRIWASCMMPVFTETAGGNRSRKTQGANMRFKVFHKFYDFEARFKDGNMCVGCGRCDMRCPQKISFFDAVNDLNEEIK